MNDGRNGNITQRLQKDKTTTQKERKKKECALVIKHCTVSYSMTRFHVSIERNWNKQIQTAILKVNTSEHIQKKVYTFFFSFCMDFQDFQQSSLVSEKKIK